MTRSSLPLLLLLGACSDYNFAGAKQENPPAGTPDIAVTPDAVVAEGACPDGAGAVQIANEGDGDLDLLAIGTVGDWTVEGVSLPRTLAPGETQALSVRGSGAGTLQITSNDPDEPELELPLAALPDEAPEIEVLYPQEGEIIEVGDAVLTTEVDDAEDAADALVVTWSSDIEGDLGSATVDAAGRSFLTWPAPRAEGEHQLTATVTDTCGNTSTADLTVCQNAGYTVDELDLSSWQFEGVAAWDASNNWLQLTPADLNVVGSAFATDAAVDAANVEISFRFYIGDGTGADGISLTALDVDRMTSFLGGTGCGLGYGGDASCTSGPALPGWSIEVDTFDNGVEVEPTANDHLAFTFNGDVDDYVAWAELPEMEDTGWHEMTVLVVAPRVTVSIDGTTYIDEVLAGDFNFDAYVGFTAGTGGQTNAHLIDSLTVTESVCEE